MVLSVISLTACDKPSAPEDVPLGYGGIEPQWMGEGLVRFGLTLENAAEPQDMADYAVCAASQYAVDQGYGYLRHIRTQIEELDGLWYGDAAYLLSKERPEGLQVIIAQEQLTDCASREIPTV